MTVLRDQKVFSREQALPYDDGDVSGTLLGLDGDEHAAVRDVVKDWFTPQAIGRLRGDIEHRAGNHLKAMCEHGEPADLLEHFALPFSLDTICDLLGLPAGEERMRFRGWASGFLGTSALTRAGVEEAMVAMFGYLGELLARRREHPADDLLTRIAVAGAGLPADRLLKLPLTLVIGGWETVTSSIGTHLEVLLTRPYGGHPSGYAYLIDHPEAIPGAVGELQRMYSTSADDDMLRTVTKDTTLPSGTRLSEGDVVIPSHDAANYDPRATDDPRRMDFGRDFRHLSFGWGPHHCIGRHLGQLNEEVALALLTRELPRLRLADADVPRKKGHAVAGPVALRVAWS